VLKTLRLTRVVSIDENIVNHIQFPQATLTEAHFLSEVAQQTGCGILLNINHLYLTAKHLSLDPIHYISNLNGQAVKEIHVTDINSNHIRHLYQCAVEQCGIKPTIILKGDHGTDFFHLHQFGYMAEAIMRNVYATIKHAS